MARNDHKTQGIEEKYRMTQEIANQRDAKLQQVSQVFAHASSVLGGGAMLGPPQPQQHPWGGNDGSMNAFATYAAPEPPQQHHMPPSQYGANPYANQHVYATVPMPPPQQTYAHQQQTYAVPESQLRPPPPPVAQMSTAGAPLQGLTERANAWQAKVSPTHPPPNLLDVRFVRRLIARLSPSRLGSILDRHHSQRPTTTTTNQPQ
jgi:hypothetical protein